MIISTQNADILHLNIAHAEKIIRGDMHIIANVVKPLLRNS